MPTKYDGSKNRISTKPELNLSELAWGPDNLGPYWGPIEPGMIFAWEPWLPWARQLVIVAHFGDTKIGTYAFPPEEDGFYVEHRINDISRFREAVVPTLFKTFPVPKRSDGADKPVQVVIPEAGASFAHPHLSLNMSKLAHDVACIWTDAQYPYEFNVEPQPHRHFTHAFIHVIKACGKITEYIDALDHGGGLKDTSVVPKALADIVISVQRMAEKYGIELEQAVRDRIDTLRERYLKKEPEDNSRYEDSARIMFEQIYPDKPWTELASETQYNWRMIAKNHFVLTTRANVAKADKGIVEDPMRSIAGTPILDVGR